MDEGKWTELAIYIYIYIERERERERERVIYEIFDIDLVKIKLPYLLITWI